MYRKFAAIIAIGALAMLASAQDVTVTLESPQNGTTIGGGSTVEWTIKALVSDGDNYGLALIAVDLVQDAANPEKLDIPPAAGVPTGMEGFSRPEGISNPGEGSATTGYIGVQRGTAGEMNLIQIGGGQNTFGEAGTTIGTDANVDGGIGQGGTPQVIATGTFTAPTTEGTYTFQLENAIANVITTLNTPPDFSPVAQANILGLASAVISFDVGDVWVKADMDCSGAVNFDDIDPFVTALVSQQDYETAYPECNWLNGDIDGNDQVNFDDIDGFVTCLVGGGCPE